MQRMHGGVTTDAEYRVLRNKFEFDPTDPERLVAAAAGGGLQGAFVDEGQRGVVVVDERAGVVLGELPGRGVALLKTDS